MHSSKRTALLVGLAIASTLTASLMASAPASAGSSVPSITTWISGLNAPRGLAFDGGGNLYLSQSGQAGTGPAGLTSTGKVSKYPAGSSTPSWTTSFESVYMTVDPSQPPDVLGPEGISALGNSCSSREHEHTSTGCRIRMIMSESHDGIAAATKGAINAHQAGRLYGLDPMTGKASSLSNVGNQQYDWTGDHAGLFPSDFPDSNPYGVLVLRDRWTHTIRTFVADAGANTISEIMANGHARVIAYIPNETTVPFRDATPTCIAQGPDGMLYVATLHFVANLFVSHSGRSDVWRVNPNANYPSTPTLWASGLTTPTACTFDRSGNFWATEMFQPNIAGPPGDVVRIPFSNPTDLDRLGGGMLPLPGGIAQGPDGAMYVSINSANPTPGSGAVVRLNTHDD
jgi:hypothetical protein